MVKILGLPFDGFVDKQVEVRQTKLAKTQKSPEDLSVFNSNTAWVRLSSGVDIDSDRATTLSSKLGIPATLIQGAGLARNLVLWGSTVGFTQEGNRAVLDPLRGGVGYGLNNAYGFLTTTDQGLKPPPGITRISCTYKNNGSLKQAVVELKCFSRSQFEAIEAVYLRLGYTMVLEWGHTLWFDNQGTYQRTEGYSIPNILFGRSGDVKPETLQGRIAKNKSTTTNGNYEAMVGKVANYNWTLNEDLSFTIRLDLVSVGDIIDSLKANIAGASETITGNIKVSGNVQNIVSIVVNKEASKINGLLFEMYDEIFKELLETYGTEETQEAVQVANTAIATAPKVEFIKVKYIPIIQEYYTLVDYYYEGLEIYKKRSSYVDSPLSFGGSVRYTSASEEEEARYVELANIFGTTVDNLDDMYNDNEAESADVENFKSKVQAIESYLETLQATGEQANAATIDYLLNQSFPTGVINQALESGYFDVEETIEVPNSKYEIYGGDWGSIIENRLGIDV
jgi:hypothetical protein